MVRDSAIAGSRLAYSVVKRISNSDTAPQAPYASSWLAPNYQRIDDVDDKESETPICVPVGADATFFLPVVWVPYPFACR